MTGGLTHYSWYNEYVELTKRYRWQVAAYIAWCASPAVGREPKTQQELAVVLGYKTDRTLRLWKEQDPTIEETIAVLQAAPLWGHRRDIYEALVRSALLEGSAGHSDRKLALELLGDYVPRSKQAVEATVTAVPFTADELAQAELELGEWASTSSATDPSASSGTEEDDKMTGGRDDRMTR